MKTRFPEGNEEESQLKTQGWLYQRDLEASI